MSGSEGGHIDGRAVVARRLRTQAGACRTLGSPLYVGVLERCARDVEAGGIVWTALAAHVDDPGPSALALRFLGALHWLALAGEAPELAAHYPSCGGDGDVDGAWEALQVRVAASPDHVAAGLARTVQTNEVGRSAALLGGFLRVSDVTRMPLRLLEVGASAGLNLRWDRYRYVDDGLAWGPPDGGLILAGHFAGRRRPVVSDIPFAGIAERRGCDVAPVDPTTVDGGRTLLSFVWPDQVERIARLRAALAGAGATAAPVERADANDWLDLQLAPGRGDGEATVVFHSVFMQYLTDAGRARHVELVEAAGAAASRAAPLAWLRMEPRARAFDVTLTMWPGGVTQLLARADGHGRGIEWLA